MFFQEGWQQLGKTVDSCLNLMFSLTIRIQLLIRERQNWAGEMAPWFRMLPAFVQDLGHPCWVVYN